MDAQLYLSNPISNAYAKGYLKTALHLEKWLNLMPLEKNTALKGEILADMNFDGHYSEIAPGKLQDLKAEGHIAINGLQYNAPSTLPLSINNLKLNLSPKQFDLPSVDLTYGKSTISANGQITNMLGYLFNEETLHGNLNLTSNGLDLNEWMNSLPKSTEETAKVDTSAPMAAPIIPANIDFQLTANAASMQFQDYNLTNCIAKLIVANGVVSIDPIKASLWGSTFEMNRTSYSHIKGGDPIVNSSVALSNLNPSKLNEKIALVNKYAPALKDIEGLANLNMNLKTNLTQEMGVDMNSVFADGNLDVLKGLINMPNWLSEAGKFFKWDAKKLELQPTKVGFIIENGELKLKDSIRMKLPKGGKMSLIGRVKLDQTIDFGGRIIAEGKSLPLKITGTVQNPKLVIDWKGFGKDLAQPYLDKGKEEIKNKAMKAADDILNKARAEADNLKQTAREKAEQLRQEARKLADKERSEGDRLASEALKKANDEADKLMGKASNPIEKFAAEKAVKILKKEAEKKANQFKLAAGNNASKIETEANKKADALVAEADNKSADILRNAEEQRNKINEK